MSRNGTMIEGDEARVRLWDLIKDMRFGMFTTRHENGHLHSRPMTTQNSKMDEDSSLWFFMSRSGDTVADLTRDPVINVVYANPDEDSYVSVSGYATVVENPSRALSLWSKMNEAWFPGGPSDPDLALVRVTIDHAGYWHMKENQIFQLFEKARSAITGKQSARRGEHGEIRMR